MFFFFLSFAAQVQAESQNADRARNQIVAEAKKGGYQLITPEELKKEYLTDPAAFLLVDARQEWSYQMQHIKGSSAYRFCSDLVESILSHDAVRHEKDSSVLTKTKNLFFTETA